MNEDQRILSRRDALRAATFAGGAALFAGRSAIAHQLEPHDASSPATPATLSTAPGDAGSDYTPVIVPNGWTLPFTLVDGVKVFHLVAEEVEHEFAAGLRAHCWGYNGSVHGPVIEAVEGDRVRIFVTNKLKAGTTVHWHGLILPSGMDGVGGLNQRAIAPGETFVYEFPLRQHGTFMYHSHHDEMTQMGMGMVGLFVIHPRTTPIAARSDPIDKDFAIMLHEWSIPVGTDRPDPNEMTDFNVLTMNAKVFPATAPLVVGKGERVRIRFGNLGPMDHHPIHLHGYNFRVTATEGGDVPPSAQRPEATVLVSVGQTRTIEFVADYPGDWALHCHMTHHGMNQMGHHIPNMIGVNAGDLDPKLRSLLPAYMTMGENGMAEMGEMGMKQPPNSISMVSERGPYDVITMGGMFTILKVRDATPADQTDPGWYPTPTAEQSDVATADTLRRNGIAPDASTAPRAPNTKPARKLTPTTAPTTTGAVTYVCPMHPEVTSSSPGKCPKCGMTLVKK